MTSTLRRVVTGICWAAAATVAIRGVSASYHTAASLRWLRYHQAAQPEATQRHVLLVLPLLREQRLISDTTARLAEMAEKWGNATVVLVTTEREHTNRAAAATRLDALAACLRRKRSSAYLTAQYARVLPASDLCWLADQSGDRARDYPQLLRELFGTTPSTPTLAARLAADSGGRVRHHHVADPQAGMVQQINTAVAAELHRLTTDGITPDDVWIGVYNADSRPHPDTLSALAACPPDSRVVQQSALFTVDSPSPDRCRRVFTTGAALLQSRWTLAREIPRLRAQARQARNGPARWPRLAHCVGHGLFVRGDTWQALGGLPEATMNEDLAFGYTLTAAGIPIEPLPLLEHGEAPGTPTSVVRQGRQWFWSYPQYPTAAGLAAGADLGASRTRGWLTVQGLARGVAWLGQSPAIAAALALPVVSRTRAAALAASAAAVTAYLYVPAVQVTAQLRRDGIPATVGARELAGILAAALTSSVGPWWCVGDVIRSRLTGTRLSHDKTER